MRLYPEAPKGSFSERNLYLGSEQGAVPGEDHLLEPWVAARSRANADRIARGRDFSRVEGLGDVIADISSLTLQSAFPHFRDAVSPPRSDLPKVLQHYASGSLRPEPNHEPGSLRLEAEGSSRIQMQQLIRSRLVAEPGAKEARGTRMSALGELEPVMGKWGYPIKDTMGQWMSPPGPKHLTRAQEVVATQEGDLWPGVGGLGSAAGALAFANAQTAQIKQALNAGDIITALSLAAGNPWRTKPTAAQVDALITSPVTGPQILQKLWDAVNSQANGQPNQGYRSPLPGTLPAATLQANLQGYLAQIPSQTASAPPVKAVQQGTVNVVQSPTTQALAAAVLGPGVAVPAPVQPTPSAASLQPLPVSSGGAILTPPPAVSPLVTGSPNAIPGTGYAQIGVDQLGRPVFGVMPGYIPWGSPGANSAPPAGTYLIGQDASGNGVYGTLGGQYQPTGPNAIANAAMAGAAPSWLPSSGGGGGGGGGDGSGATVDTSGQGAPVALAPAPTGLQAPITLPLVGTVPLWQPLAAAAAAFFLLKKKHDREHARRNKRRKKGKSKR